MAKQTLLIVTDSFGTGSARRLLHSLAMALPKEEYAVTIAHTPEESPFRKQERQAGIQHHAFSRNIETEALEFVRDVDGARAELKRTKPNLILFFSGSSPLFNLAYLQAAEELNVPFLFLDYQPAETHFEIPGPEKARISAYYRNAGSASLLSLSQQHLKGLQQCLGLAESFGSILPCGVSASAFEPRSESLRMKLRKKLNIPEKAFVVLAAFPFEDAKCLEALYRTFESLRGEQLYLLAMGTTQAEQPALPVPESVAEAIRFLPAPKLGVYDCADLFLRPSYADGIPTPLFEAMAKGLACIAVSGSGAEEWISDAGIILPCHGIERVPSELEQVLRSLAADSEKREALGRRAHTRAEECFHEEALHNGLLQAIQKKIGPKELPSLLQGAESGSRVSPRKNLVIVCAGDASLHEQWLLPDGDRNWDLWVQYHGSQKDYCLDGAQVEHASGSKWQIITSLYQRRRAELEEYDYVCFPDEDLTIRPSQFNKMFSLCSLFGLELAQPALTGNSRASNAIELVNAAFVFRFSNYVDGIAPIFCKEMLAHCLPTFNAYAGKEIPGLLWPSLVTNPRKAAILDSCPIQRKSKIEPGLHEGFFVPTGNSVPPTLMRIEGGLLIDGKWVLLTPENKEGFKQLLVNGFYPVFGSHIRAMLELVDAVNTQIPAGRSPLPMQTVGA